MGQHQSPSVDLQVGIPQGSVLGPLLFAAFCSPIVDVTASHGVCYHQYADDTQLHFAMRADKTAEGLTVLSACIADVRQWYLQNGLHDKSEALVIGTINQQQVTTSAMSTVSVAGGRPNESAGSRARSPSDIRQTRVRRGVIVQLSCMCHPPHPSSHFDRSCADTGL